MRKDESTAFSPPALEAVEYGTPEERE